MTAANGNGRGLKGGEECVCVCWVCKAVAGPFSQIRPKWYVSLGDSGDEEEEQRQFADELLT